MTTIKLKRGTSTAWTATNPVLAAGEPGIESDTRQFKFGDGITAWNDLQYSSVDFGPGDIDLLWLASGGATIGSLLQFDGNNWAPIVEIGGGDSGFEGTLVDNSSPDFVLNGAAGEGENTSEDFTLIN